MIRRRSTTGGERDRLAPVVPLFRGATHPVFSGAGRSDTSDRDGDDADGHDARGEIRGEPSDEIRNRAERTLMRRLATRSLSVREARAVVAERDLSPTAVDDMVADFIRRGYLDDAALADQLVRAGTERKGQGRQALAQTLAKRGIPRDVADAAVAALPDDDADRALAFARTRAGALQSVPSDAALRRLIGQLSRRGFPASVAMSAARQALAEVASGP